MHAGESPLRLGEYYDSFYNRSLHHMIDLASRTVQRAMRAALSRRHAAAKLRVRQSAVHTLQRGSREWLGRLRRESGIVDLRLQIFTAALQRSIRHRFPYIDPLHHLQVELVRRYRAGQADERVQRGIHISINGIAAGLRNTG